MGVSVMAKTYEIDVVLGRRIEGKLTFLKIVISFEISRYLSDLSTPEFILVDARFKSPCDLEVSMQETVMLQQWLDSDEGFALADAAMMKSEGEEVR
jgi:hypothetical protein